MRSIFVKGGIRLALPCLALSVLCAQALEQAEEPNVLTGVSVGFSLLYNNLSLKVDHKVETPGLETYIMSKRKVSTCVFKLLKNIEPYIKSRKKKSCGIDPVISLGYSIRIDNWQFGVVGEVSLVRSRKSKDVFDNELSVETKIPGFSSTLKLNGGYYFREQNTLMYGIVGMKWRNKSIANKFNYLDDRKLFFAGAKSNVANPQWLLGIGIERPVSKKVTVYGEYEYSWRKAKDKELMLGKVADYKFRIKQKVKEQSFRVGVKYYI